MTDVSMSAKHLYDYLVAILVDGCLYLYPVLCASHDEAIEIATAEHEKAGRPLPEGAPLVVKGPCRDADCDCGKLRTKTGWVITANAQPWLN